jgi:hypothetical protein
MTGLFGAGWNEIVDFFLKLAPAASILGGIFAARVSEVSRVRLRLKEFGFEDCQA